MRRQREAEFLLELLRKKPNSDHLRETLSRDRWFDWDLLEELLFCSRTVSLAASILAGDEPIRSLFPDALAGRIIGEGERAAFRSLVKESEFDEVTGAFRAMGLPHIVLKGLPFGARYFGDPARRDVRDLDLLIPPESLSLGERVLRRLGYDLFEGVQSRAWYRRHHFHLVFVRRRAALEVVELHWNLLPFPVNRNVDTAELFRKGREIPFRGGEIRVLNPLDEAVFLCASLRLDQFTSLKRIVDLDRVLEEGGEVNRDALLGRAREWSIEEEARTALFFLDKFRGDKRRLREAPPRIRRFAFRFRWTDFFGIKQGRVVRLRLWCGYHFGYRRPAVFLFRLLFPDETFRAEVYFSEESRPPFGSRLRRFFAGLYASGDLILHLLIAWLRAPR
ncbi:MAG: nucleotidyltransferase family protein [Candidatus Eisenbacteria bacterium]|nr:nucleotidyltransferase family protein [Candidatus Eisenbacteria bacterium]